MPQVLPTGVTLGFVTTMTAHCHGGRAAIHVATGRVADALARQYARVYLCAGVIDQPPQAATDLRLEAPNVELIPQPTYRTTLGGLLHPVGLVRAYVRTCRRSDRILIRGFPPYAFVLYLLAWLWRRPVCQWAVGNPIALLKASPRRGWLRDRLGLLYARADFAVTRACRWLVDGAFVCNGQELGVLLRSPRTYVTASSTVTERDFHDRADTCQSDVVRLLFVGYLRPEKGVEFLLEALPLLNLGKPWELTLVGPDEYPEYRRKIDAVIARHNLAGRLRFAGYVSFGEPMFACMRAADVFILPTLSEGTPHVLVETRAQGLPTISTMVGGVPTSVTDGVDALLVPPKDPTALARAIERVVRDGDLRRRLIRNGYEGARRLTVDRFAELVLRTLDGRTAEPLP